MRQNLTLDYYNNFKCIVYDSIHENYFCELQCFTATTLEPCSTAMNIISKNIVYYKALSSRHHQCVIIICMVFVYSGDDNVYGFA